MIDWYLLIFLFIGILIFNLEKLANSSSLINFIGIKGGAGIKHGTILVWVSLCTQIFLFIPVYTVLHFGLLSSILSSVCFLFLVYVIVQHLSRILSAQPADKPILLEYYQSKLSRNAFPVMMILIFIANIDGFILQLPLAGFIFHVNFSNSAFYFTLFITVFSVLIAGLGGMQAIYRTGYVFLLICGFILFFVPLFLYLKEGIHTVFQHFTHMSIQPENRLIFGSAIIMTTIGNLMTHSFLWQALLSISSNYRRSGIKLSIFCYAAVPFSVTLYTVYYISHAYFQHPSLITTHFFALPLAFFQTLILIVWLFSIVTSVMFSIFSLALLFIKFFYNNPSQKIARNFYLIVMATTAVLLLLQIGLCKYLSFIWKGYFLFYVAVSLPFWSLLMSRKKHTLLFPTSVVLIWLIGVALLCFSHKLLLALIITGVGSMLIFLLVLLPENRQDFIK
ncbi:hypothetical protein [Heyndrickxia ginsengihumi]|uniref:hypothetical protein n=1 Tax=Heyndrickxia ginsengihumi TaxID=363870 RepID=UPI003D1F4C0E